MLRIRAFSFFSLIEKCEISDPPRFLGSSQDTSALLDVMLVTVRFIGLSGTKPMGKKYKYNFEICDK